MKFRHSGDLGDVIFMLPILRAIGGKHEILFVDRNTVSPRTNVLTTRAHLLEPLLMAQEYVKSVKCSEEHADITMEKFRMFHSSTTTLVEAQVSYFNMISGMEISEDGRLPWITVPGKRIPSGKIIVSRTPRYNNDSFPWRKIMDFYGNDLLFVGTDGEHGLFQSKFGNIKRLVVSNFLELAIHINNSNLFIGNQSSPHSIAMGLGHQIIQEVCQWQPDCIFKRDNVQYVGNGSCELPSFSKKKNSLLVIENEVDQSLLVYTGHVPPGRWQYPGLAPHTHFDLMKGSVSRLENCSIEEAHRRLINYNMERLPEYFNRYEDSTHKLVDCAKNKAYCK